MDINIFIFSVALIPLAKNIIHYIFGWIMPAEKFKMVHRELKTKDSLNFDESKTREDLACLIQNKLIRLTKSKEPPPEPVKKSITN